MLEPMTAWMPESATLRQLVEAMLVAGAASVAWGIARWWLVRGIARLIARTRITWDDALVEARVFAHLAPVAPAFVVYFGASLVEGLSASAVVLAQRVSLAVMVVAAVVSASAFLTAMNEIYSRNPEYRRRPIKGYLQVIKIALAILTTVVVVSILVDRSPWLFLSGLGAMTAVVLLIFKDTLLSLVASIQIASNDMIHVGDWIEMPEAGADGDVIDVALHTVKVQNWDKTITTIPTHRLIEGSFKNWRGMTQAGGRRIKRAVHVDLSSVRFLDDADLERFGRWALLADYIREKREELARWNQQPGRDSAINADIRRLTNVGTLRAYIRAYLRAHPGIHQTGHTLIVRQLAPGPTGLPIEIYCFTNDVAWERYEGIQADIFDHILAILPDFGLRIFQVPGGVDLERLAPRTAGG